MCGLLWNMRKNPPKLNSVVLDCSSRIGLELQKSWIDSNGELDEAYKSQTPETKFAQILKSKGLEWVK